MNNQSGNKEDLPGWSAKNSSSLSVPNPLLSGSPSTTSPAPTAPAPTAPAPTAPAPNTNNNNSDRLNRLAAEKVRATELTNAAAAAAAASLQNKRPSSGVYKHHQQQQHNLHHHHHKQQQQQQHYPPLVHNPPPGAAAAAAAGAAPGMFSFNHHMMGGFPYPTAAATTAGMNYFHPVNSSFVLPRPLSAVPTSAPPAAATTTATTTTTATGNSVGGEKRKATTSSEKYTAAVHGWQRAKKQRPSSTSNAMIDLTTTQDPKPSNTAEATTTTTTAATTATVTTNNNKSSTTTTATTTTQPPRDPPGFEAFQRDPRFITAIMASRLKENGNTDKLLGPLARGIINMTDEEIFQLSDHDETDSTLRVFITDVIMPLLGIDDHIAQSNYSIWQGYAHISSENLRSLAKNFFYVRRSSMKAAVQVAFFEMRKNHQKLLLQAGEGQAGREQQSGSGTVDATATAAAAANNAAAKLKIQQLKQELQKQKEENAKMITQIEEIYESDIADMRNDHKLHVEELKEAHRKEVEGLREEMEEMKCSHREFLGHYVEAAAEAVRLAQKQGKSSSSTSLGRAISDL